MIFKNFKYGFLFLSLLAFNCFSQDVKDIELPLYPIYSEEGLKHLTNPCKVKLKNDKIIVFTALMNDPSLYNFNDKVVLDKIYPEDILEYLAYCPNKKDNF